MTPVELYIISVENTAAVVVESIAGNRAAEDCIFTISDSLKQLARGQATPKCLLCEHQFKRKTPPPIAFAILLPFFRDISQEQDVISSPICVDCYVKHSPGLDRVVVERYQLLWPEAQFRKVVMH